MACSNEILDIFSWILQERFLLIDILIISILSHLSVDINCINTFGENYSSIREINNTQNQHETAIVNEQRVVARTPVCVSKVLNVFLSLPVSHLEPEVTM